ncbi:MAG: hypothetical protein RL748_1126, partial [Pseudomonadota bacterium]
AIISALAPLLQHAPCFALYPEMPFLRAGVPLQQAGVLF